jgi:hypothetical protein
MTDCKYKVTWHDLGACAQLFPTVTQSQSVSLSECGVGLELSLLKFSKGRSFSTSNFRCRGLWADWLAGLVGAIRIHSRRPSGHRKRVSIEAP